MEEGKAKMEKKSKVKRIKDRVSIKDRLGGLFFTVIALAVAAVVFAGFMFLQSYFSEKIVYKEILVVKKEIPEGEIITESNISNYFGRKKINALNVVAGSLAPSEATSLYGLKAKVVLREGEEVATTDFLNTNVYLDNIKDPVEMSITTSGIGFTNGGKIRAGDIVNITLMFSSAQLGLDANLAPSVGDNTTVESNSNQMGSLTQFGDDSEYNFEFYARYMLENIYIEKVLTADGVEISPTDKSTAAGIIVLVVPKAIELKLNNILANCQNMRISKALYEITPEDLYQDPSLKEDIGKLDNLEEGWVTKDGVSYKPSIKEGTSHYKKDSLGNITEEACKVDDATGTCSFCDGKVGNENEKTESPIKLTEQATTKQGGNVQATTEKTTTKESEQTTEAASIPAR